MSPKSSSFAFKDSNGSLARDSQTCLLQVVWIEYLLQTTWPATELGEVREKPKIQSARDRQVNGDIVPQTFLLLVATDTAAETANFSDFSHLGG